MPIERQLVEVRRLGDGAPGFIHESAGQQQQRALAADRPFAGDALKTPAPRPDAVALGDFLVTAMKPMLWRLPAYFAPGFPSPTRSSIGVVPRRQTSLLLGCGGSRCRAGSSTRRRAWGSARSRAFGRRTGRCGGGSRGRCGGGSFGLGLHFFRIA